MASRTTNRRRNESTSKRLGRAWDRLAKHVERVPAEAARAGEVGEVLEAVEKRGEVLGDLAGDVLAGALEAWLRGKDEAALRFLEVASAREVIDSVERSARTLEEEARRREAQREALLALTKDLGRMGVRLLLGVLVSV